MPGELAAQFVCLVPTEVLLSAERVGFLGKPASAGWLGGRQSRTDGVVQSMFERDAPLSHPGQDHSLGVGIKSDPSPHEGIVASIRAAS